MAPKQRQGRKTDGEMRATASGFHVKLRRWLEANRENYELGRGDTGPRNGRQLAKLLTSLGEPISDVAVGLWRRGLSLPESRYISHLERLMGAPWAYLDSAEFGWPRKWTRAALAELFELFSDGELDGLAERARRELAPRPKATGR